VGPGPRQGQQQRWQEMGCGLRSMRLPTPGTAQRALGGPLRWGTPEEGLVSVLRATTPDMENAESL